MASKGWHIPRRHRSCAVTNEAFEAGQEYYSLLVQEDNTYTRRDYSTAGWEEYRQSSEWDKEATFWKARIPARHDKVKDSKELGQRALELLRTALDENADAEAFVLALYLVRLKMLIQRQQAEHEGKPSIFYELLETSEILIVPEVPLTNLEVTTLQTTIAAKLKGEAPGDKEASADEAGGEDASSSEEEQEAQLEEDEVIQVTDTEEVP